MAFVFENEQEVQPAVEVKKQRFVFVDEDTGFKDWYSGWANKTGINPDPDDPRHKYDYRAAYKAGAIPKISPENGKHHWPSEFKAYDHPNRYVNGIDTKTGKTVSKTEEAPFEARHPTAYGVYGAVKETAKTLIPYLKYVDPDERDRFMKLTKQKQVRELLIQDMETIGLLAFEPVMKGVKPVVSEVMKRWLPKTYKILTKPIGKRGTKAVLKGTEEPIVSPALAEKAPEIAAEEVAGGELVSTKPKSPSSTPVLIRSRPTESGQLYLEFDATEGRIPIVDEIKIFAKEKGFDVEVVRLTGMMGEVRNTGRFRLDVFKNGRISSEATKSLSEEFGGTFQTMPSKISKAKKAEEVAGAKPQEAVSPESQETAVQRVITALKEAKPIRAEQEAIYTQARGERIKKAIEIGGRVPGEAGYYAKLSKMKGEMSKVEFHSIREKIGQADIDILFAQINENVAISEFEKLTAGRGLAKLFGEFGGNVPTEGELALLNKVFGQEFVKATLSKRSLWAKAKEVGLELANIPRALMASFDLSAPLRQGVFLVGRPKQWAPAFRDMFKYFVSEKSFAALGEEIATRPTYKLMKEGRLALTELGTKMTAREEEFMSSYASKIPIIGRGVRASERAYTGFLNRLRADVFDDIIGKAAKLGIDDPKFIKDAANFINHATGRGTLGALEKVAVPLNAVFFSPRLIASRLNLLNPAFYIKLHPQARKEAISSLFTFGAVAGTVGGLMAASGAKVGVDPRSADFMKIKFGNKRYDILGGFQQPIRMAAQVISGEVVSSTTGKVITLGEGYRGLTRTEVMSRFLESKEAPVASFITALVRGKTGLGEKVDIPTEVINRFVPMVMQDMVDFYKEEGAKGVLMAAPALFGVGAMSYGGVQSYGLSGKDYPKLNAELNRLKTSMGYPSSVAFGQELTNKEYKALKVASGNEIAKRLKNLIALPEYKSLDDRFKVKEIETTVDATKDEIKLKMFPNKKIKSEVISELKATRGLTTKEAEGEAQKFIDKESLDSSRFVFVNE